MAYSPTIENDEINQLPLIAFGGEIVVVDSQDQVANAVECLQKELVVGYDTETRPSFKKGKNNDVALLQLSGEKKCYLFRLNKIKIDQTLTGLLEDDAVMKIGAAITDDIKIMNKLHRFTPKGFVDLQKIVKEHGIEAISVKKMAAIVLGGKVSKAQRLSNWEAQQLTVPQMIYAATDAWVCREIYMKLNR